MIDVIVRMPGSVNINSDTLSQISMHGGGAAANTATWLSHLGVNTTFVGRVGSDLAGANFRNELEQFGVQHHQGRMSDRNTGTVVVLVDPSGNRTMFPDPGANSGLSEIDLPELVTTQIVFLSGYSLFNPASSSGVLRMIQAIRRKEIPIFFDVASVGTIDAFGKKDALALITGFVGLFMNEEEAIYLTGSHDNREQFEFLEKFAPINIIKRGPLGAKVKAKGSEVVEMPAVAAKVIDTTGAGDSFAAGFLTEWLSSKDLATSLAEGLRVSAECVATIGARPRVNP